MDTVETALCSIRVQHGISILQSDSFEDTVALLHSIHQELLHSLAARPPCASTPTFAQFMIRTSKSGNLQLGDIFAKMLLQINGLSPARAQVVLAVYPTVADVTEAGPCAHHRRCTALSGTAAGLRASSLSWWSTGNDWARLWESRSLGHFFKSTVIR